MRGWVLVAGVACSPVVGPLDGPVPGPGDAPIAHRAAIELSRPYMCQDPSARDVQRFDRRAPAAQPDDADYRLTRAGILVADLDGDRWLDVLLPHGQDTELWMGAPDGTLVDRAPARLGDLDLTGVVGGSAVDVEGDGDLDLYLTRWRLPNLLLRNDGTGHFTDVTERAGLLKYSWRSQSSSWADFDLDGDLDLFSGSYGPDPDDLGEFSFDSADLPPSEDDSQLWRNEGDGTFTDLSDLLPAEVQDGWTFMSTWVDTTGDGFPELFVWHDFGTSHPSVVLANDAGRGFVLELGRSYVDAPFEDMGVGMADVNGDQLPDFAVSSYRKVRLLLSTDGASYAGPTWVDNAAARGIAVDTGTWDQVYGWGAEFTDLDNDRDEDLVMLFGRWSEYDDTPDARTERDGLWIRDDDGRFENRAATPEWQLDDDGVKRGLAIADLNDDGFPDLVKRQLDGPALRYESRCDDRAWLGVTLRQPDQNPSAVGARVTVTSPDGLVQTRWVTAGSTSMYSSTPATAHFGLGDDPEVDVEVLWPDLGVSTVRQVPTRRRLTVIRQ